MPSKHGGRGLAQTMNTHVSKCRNNKIKGEKKTKEKKNHKALSLNPGTAK
jgi:hypothetical protein